MKRDKSIMKKKSRTTYYAHPEGEPVSREELDRDVDKILFYWKYKSLKEKYSNFLRKLLKIFKRGKYEKRN
jgi:hypothetical protein